MDPEPAPKKDIVVAKLELPKRRKGNYRTNGSTLTKIIVNLLKVSYSKIDKVYIHSIKIKPQISADNKVLLDNLLREALPSIKKQINNPIFGGLNIYSTQPPTKDEDTHQVRGYVLTVKKVRFFDSKNKMVQLQFLNNAIRFIMNKLQYIQIGQTGKYYNKKGESQIIAGLSLYPGMKVNFVLAQDQRLFLRIQPTCKIVQKMTVLQFINQTYFKNKSQDRDAKRQIVNEALANKIVMTNYGKTRYVRVESVKFLPLREVMVPENSNTNIIQYFYQKYSIQINEKQPLLSIQNKRKKDDTPTYIPPELCLMTGIPDDIDENRRRAISEKTIVPPRQKLQAIQGLARRINSTPEIDCLKQLNIHISNDLQEVQAMTLPNPGLQLHDGWVDRGREAGFNLYNQRLYDPSSTIKMAFIYFDRNLSSELQSSIRHTSQALGLTIDILNYQVGSSHSHPSLNQLKIKLEKTVKQAVENNNRNCCLIVIPSNMKLHYKSIKKYCLDEIKVVTQIVTQGTLKKKNVRSIQTKILLQTAVKGGNTLWAPTNPPDIKGKAMLVSFDISRAGRIRKLTGIATVNDSLTRYSSMSVNLQQTADKFQKMCAILLQFVRKYSNRNKKIPEEIIILTNSCPRNEVKLLHEFFIDHAKEELFKTSPNIKLTVVQLKDLTNERFFVRSQDGRDVCNPNAGLLVRNTIVSDNYDFYLVSQKPRVGCTVPIHFVCIFTNSDLEEGILQELLYNQCFNYANWTGSIKIPAIMQYAKKFARFSSEVLDERNVEGNLCNRLYFI